MNKIKTVSLILNNLLEIWTKNYLKTVLVKQMEILMMTNKF